MTALDRFPVVTRDGIDIHVDRRGWPVETCGRCGGTGRYSYCEMYGDTCFGCSGRCVVIAAGKVAGIVADYRAAVSAQKARVGYSLAVGDEVRKWDAPKGTPYRLVVAVEDTGRWCSKSRNGSEPERVRNYQLVTFDDGETVEAGAALMAGKVTVDRAPYVEAAQAAYVAKVKRTRRPAAVR